MITERGLRHVARLRELLDEWVSGRRHRLDWLIADIEGLLALLLDEANPEWVDELRTESNRLELVNAVVIYEDRAELTAEEEDEIADAIRQLRLMLVEY